MKKTLLLVAIFYGFIQDANSQAFYVEDYAFEKALVDLGYDDVVDQQVLYANVSGIDSIDLSNKRIYDMTGIRSFASLKYLNCSGNFIQQLDDLPPNLRYLDCSNNNLEYMSVRDPFLETLICNNNNFLYYFDITNTPLSYLDCSNAGITELDLTTVSTLDSLDCSGNSLTDIDLSTNPLLSFVDCANNQLISLDVSSNSALNHFDCTDNPDLSCVIVNTSQLNSIPAGWSKDTQTDYSLTCGQQPITSIPDVSFEQALVDLGHDDLLDGGVLTDSISSITSLDLSYQNISDLSGIEDFSSLSSLDIEGNLLTNLDLTPLIDLQYLYCNDNQLTNLVLNNSSLIRLHAHRNQLQYLDVSKHLSLEYCYVHTNELLNLVLPETQTLTRLYIQKNELTDLDITKNEGLQYLYATKNEMDCILVTQAQLNDINSRWRKDLDTSYAMDCDLVERTAIPDVAFEQALIDLGHDDILNGSILTCNVIDIVSLDVSNRGISDLNGIEDFYALEVLHIEDNELVFLDLFNNEQLLRLYAQRNKLRGLDLNDNIFLEYCYVHTNDIKHLILPFISNLTRLYAQKNIMVDLDVSGTDNLITMNVTDNNLTCIAVNEPQLLAIPDNWSTDDGVFYSLDVDCRYYVRTTVNNDSPTETANTVSIYPNPSSAQFSMDIPEGTEIDQVSIYNALGQHIQRIEISTISDRRLDFGESLSKGLYYIEVDSNVGRLAFTLLKN